MILRVQFFDRQNSNLIHSWCLFNVDDALSLREVFDGIYKGTISCGRELKLQAYDKGDVLASTFSGIKKCPSVSDLMPTPLSIKSIHLKENGCALFIQFELKLGKAAQETLEVEVTVSSPESTEETLDTVTNVLMNRRDYYVSPRRVAKNKVVEQYNALVNFVKQKKFGVGATSLQDFEEFLLLFSALLVGTRSSLQEYM